VAAPAVALPDPALQLILVTDVMLIPNADTGWVIVALVVAVHPLLSLTVTVYVPATRPVAVTVFWLPASLQLYVYGEVPPVAVPAVAEPMPPLHNTFISEAKLIPRIPGWVIVAAAVAVHPLLSLAVIV